MQFLAVFRHLLEEEKQKLLVETGARVHTTEKYAELVWTRKGLEKAEELLQRAMKGDALDDDRRSDAKGR